MRYEEPKLEIIEINMMDIMTALSGAENAQGDNGIPTQIDF